MEFALLIAAVFLACQGVAHAAAAAGVVDLASWKLMAGIALGGLVLGLGRLLASNEKLTWRLAIGRAIVSAGVSIGAGAVLLVVPEIPVLALVGIAALAAVLGEQFIEKLIQDRYGHAS